MEYHSSGHFSVADKLRHGLRKNILAGVLAFLLSIVYVIFNVATGNGSFSQVIGFMMAMGNTYGVLIIIVLMGNGLVGLPKRLWQLTDIEGELIRYYILVRVALIFHCLRNVISSIFLCLFRRLVWRVLIKTQDTN